MTSVLELFKRSIRTGALYSKGDCSDPKHANMRLEGDDYNDRNLYTNYNVSADSVKIGDMKSSSLSEGVRIFNGDFSAMRSTAGNEPMIWNGNFVDDDDWTLEQFGHCMLEDVDSMTGNSSSLWYRMVFHQKTIYCSNPKAVSSTIGLYPSIAQRMFHDSDGAGYVWLDGVAFKVDSMRSNSFGTVSGIGLFGYQDVLRVVDRFRLVTGARFNDIWEDTCPYFVTMDHTSLNTYMGWEIFSQAREFDLNHWMLPQRPVSFQVFKTLKPWWFGVTNPTQWWVKLCSVLTRHLECKQASYERRILELRKFLPLRVVAGEEALCYVELDDEWVPVDVSGHFVNWGIIGCHIIGERNKQHLTYTTRYGVWDSQDSPYHNLLEIGLAMAVLMSHPYTRDVYRADYDWLIAYAAMEKRSKPYRLWTVERRQEAKQFGLKTGGANTIKRLTTMFLDAFIPEKKGTFGVVIPQRSDCVTDAQKAQKYLQNIKRRRGARLMTECVCQKPCYYVAPAIEGGWPLAYSGTAFVIRIRCGPNPSSDYTHSVNAKRMLVGEAWDLRMFNASS